MSITSSPRSNGAPPSATCPDPSGRRWESFRGHTLPAGGARRPVLQHAPWQLVRTGPTDRSAIVDEISNGTPALLPGSFDRTRRHRGWFRGVEGFTRCDVVFDIAHRAVDLLDQPTLATV